MSDEEDGNGSLEKFKSTFEKILLFLAILMFISIVINPDFFDQLGGAAHNVLYPIANLPIEISILIVAMVTSALSSVAQKFGGGMEGQKDKQERLKELNDEIMEAKERGNDKRASDLKKERNEITREMMGSMGKQFKKMAYILVITIPMFAWIYYVTDPANAVYEATSMLMPFIGEVDLSVRIWVMPAWLIWYFVCSMPASQISRKVANAGI